MDGFGESVCSTIPVEAGGFGESVFSAVLEVDGVGESVFSLVVTFNLDAPSGNKSPFSTVITFEGDTSRGDWCCSVAAASGVNIPSNESPLPGGFFFRLNTSLIRGLSPPDAVFTRDSPFGEPPSPALAASIVDTA